MLLGSASAALIVKGLLAAASRASTRSLRTAATKLRLDHAGFIAEPKTSGRGNTYSASGPPRFFGTTVAPRMRERARPGVGGNYRGSVRYAMVLAALGHTGRERKRRCHPGDRAFRGRSHRSRHLGHRPRVLGL